MRQNGWFPLSAFYIRSGAASTQPMTNCNKATSVRFMSPFRHFLCRSTKPHRHLLHRLPMHDTATPGNNPRPSPSRARFCVGGIFILSSCQSSTRFGSFPSSSAGGRTWSPVCGPSVAIFQPFQFLRLLKACRRSDFSSSPENPRSQGKRKGRTVLSKSAVQEESQESRESPMPPISLAARAYTN